jgi:putative Holliday junction resolvase
MPKPHNLLALDVGDRRVGVAIASSVARLPRPLTTLLHDENTASEIRAIVQRENVATIIVGLPRNMQGEETAQSKKVREFAASLSTQVPMSLEWQDETLSTVEAESRQRAQKQPDVSVDALAATIILEDYLHSLGGRNV